MKNEFLNALNHGQLYLSEQFATVLKKLLISRIQKFRPIINTIQICNLPIF